MPISITYGDVAAYGQLGAAAGQAAAERTAQEQLIQVQEAQANRQAQTETQLTMQGNQQAFAREMAQFDTFIKKEQIQQEHAWQVEEADVRRRHDLEMQLKDEDFKYNMELQDWARKDSIRKRKLEALEQARKDGVIDGEGQYNSLKLALELDVEPYPESLGLAGRAGGKSNDLADLLKQSMAEGPTPAGQTGSVTGTVTPEQIQQVEALPQKPTGDIVTPEAVQQAIVNVLPALPPTEQRELKAVIALGNPALTQKAFERLQTLGVKPGKPARIPWYRGQRPIGGTTTRNLSTEGQVPDYVQKRIDEDRAAASAPRPTRQPEAYAGIPESFIGATMLETEKIKQLLNQGMDEEEIYQYFLKRGSNLRQPPLLGR